MPKIDMKKIDMRKIDVQKIDVQKMNLTGYGFSGYLAKPSLASEQISYATSGSAFEHGVVVFLGGESVMFPFLKLGKAMAKLFAKQGFCALSVSLFGAAELPDSPDQIPLEYALYAVDYLKEIEKCEKITVYGMSMGSIVALGTAIHRHDVDNLIMMSPSHVAFEGVSKDKKIMRGRSFLTLNGKDIPYVSADFSKYKMYEAYENAYADKEREATAMAALPITEVKSRILLMAGEKDSSWPSAYSVQLLYDCLKKSHMGIGDLGKTGMEKQDLGKNGMEKGEIGKSDMEKEKMGKSDMGKLVTEKSDMGKQDTKYSCKKILYPKYGHMLPLKKAVMKRVFAWIKES